jgi:tetraacyldisaccharide 4'-kinase
MNPLSSAALRSLSVIYRAITHARLIAYQRKWLAVSQLAVPVISIGNLTTGGTGKTPLVDWVCRVLAGEGPHTNVGTREVVHAARRVCVLTRGYGRPNPASQVLVSNATEILAGERAAGDEPYLLATNLLGVAAVICNPNRQVAGEWAIDNLASEVFVLDDGFQHLQLVRDLDIVTIDARNPWGSGKLLPYGRLREPPQGLSRADCVVITRSEQIEDLSSVKDSIQKFAGATPIFTSRMVTSGIRTLRGDPIDKENVAQPIAAFCGVGNPASFFNHLRGEGYQPVLTRTFPDHHGYQQSELDRLVIDAQALGAKSLITTAKDAVKLSHMKLDLRCFVLEIEISIDDEEGLGEIIRKACRDYS